MCAKTGADTSNTSTGTGVLRQERTHTELIFSDKAWQVPQNDGSKCGLHMCACHSEETSPVKHSMTIYRLKIC